MAQTGFTPILLYSSSTSTNVPLAANLTNSTNGAEIAINIADKNLFFKDSGGVVNTVPIRQSSASSNGWLSSTDWSTFNSKAPATSGTSILYGNGSGGFSNVTIGSGISFAGGTLSATGSGGTVTSVTGTNPIVSSGGTTPAISLATAYGDTLNPYASKTANYILAAPNGSAGVPTFRALIAADLPSLSGTYIPYTGASGAIDLNAQTVTNIAHLGINTTSVPDILLRAFGDNNSASRIAIRGYSSNASSSSMRVAKFRGTYAAPQAPLSGDSLGKFELAGYGTTSANGYPQASYEGVATENWGATARGAKTLFYVTPNTTITQAVALTLDQDKSATFASTVTATSFSGSGSSLTGVVTSVTGTSPVVSSGGQTPAISMPAATTSVSGYLTSTDWNTFNNKGSGTVTSVSGTTGRITSTGGATPVIDLASGVATAGTTGSSTLIPVITIDTYGRVTGITTAANPQGTVTSVTGTAPVVSSGGATPAISMAAATSSVNGYLTSTDWTTFNNKGSGTVTSVAALTLGTTGTDLSSTVATGTTTPVITLNVPTASATNRGALSSTDWSTFNGKAPGVTFTANYIPYGQGTTTLNQSSGLQFDGTNFTTTGYATATSFRPSSSTTPTNGLYLPATNAIGLATNSTLRMYFTAGGSIGIGNTTVGARVTLSNDYTLGFQNAAGGMTGSSAGAWIVKGTDNNWYFDNFENDMVFRRAGYTETARVFASGGVSIGNTTDPGATNLSVTGKATIQTLTIGLGASNISTNTALGYNTLAAVTTASNSVAVGYGAGSGLTTGGAGGGYNTFVGTNAGSSTTTGYYHTILGFNAQPSSSSSNAEFVVGINAVGKGASTGYISYSGGMYQGNNSAVWSITSDARLKKNIVDNTIGLSAITAIQVRNFEYRTKNEITELEPQNAIEITGVQLGAIAQELQAILPDCVKVQSTGVMSVDTTNITWYLINAIKELNNKFDAYVASHP